MMKAYIIVVTVIFAGYYLFSNNVHSPKDALAYAQKHPDPKWAPMIDYYVGSYYFHRGEFGVAQQAYMQLLTDYTTSQYEAQALANLGTAAEENHDYGIAKGALAHYMQDFPNGPDKEVVQKKLELIKYHHGFDVEIYPPPKE